MEPEIHKMPPEGGHVGSFGNPSLPVIQLPPFPVRLDVVLEHIGSKSPERERRETLDVVGLAVLGIAGGSGREGAHA